MCKRGCKESIYIYVTSNRNVKPNKEKIYKSNKYIEMHVEKYLIEIIKVYEK